LSPFNDSMPLAAHCASNYVTKVTRIAAFGTNKLPAKQISQVSAVVCCQRGRIGELA